MFSAAVFVAAGILTAAYARPAAVVNKLLARRGRRTFATPSELAGALFGHSAKVDVALQVVAAFVLLGAGAATVGGIWRIARGADGGVALAASGVYGVLGLMAALTVVM